MLLEFIQRENILEVAYFDKEGKVKVINVDITSKMFNYILEREYKTGKGQKTETKIAVEDALVKNWDGRTLYRAKTNKLCRQRCYDVLNELPQDIQDEIFCDCKPDMFFCDIETMIDDSGFPDPNQASLPISCIGFSHKHTAVVLGYKPLSEDQQRSISNNILKHFEFTSKTDFRFKYIYCQNEYEMLYRFICLCSKMAIITGWNFTGFDWLYIANRCKILGIDMAMGSPMHEIAHLKIVDRNGKSAKCDRPAFVGIFDYMDAYCTFPPTGEESMRLDDIGEKVVGANKVTYNGSLQELYENDFERYIFYNAIDCILVELIHEKKQSLTAGLLNGWLAKAEAISIFSKTALTERLLANEFFKEGKRLAKKDIDWDAVDEEEESTKYEGAFVKQPVTGYHKVVCCNDFASLYPSVIRMMNVGPETYVNHFEEGTITPTEQIMLNKFREDRDNYIVTSDNTIYRKKDGHLKLIMTDLFAKRKRFKRRSYVNKQLFHDINDFIKNDAPDEEVLEYLKHNNITLD